MSGFKIEQVRDMLLKALRDRFLIKSCLQPKVLKGHVGNLRFEMLPSFGGTTLISENFLMVTLDLLKCFDHNVDLQVWVKDINNELIALPETNVTIHNMFQPLIFRGYGPVSFSTIGGILFGILMLDLESVPLVALLMRLLPYNYHYIYVYIRTEIL